MCRIVAIGICYVSAVLLGDVKIEPFPKTVDIIIYKVDNQVADNKLNSGYAQQMVDIFHGIIFTIAPRILAKRQIRQFLSHLLTTVSYLKCFT